MIRILLLVLACLLVGGNAFSQKQTYDPYFSVYFGKSFPLGGAFAHMPSPSGNIYSGRAKDGYMTQIFFGFPLFKTRFGLGAEISIGTHRYNAQSLADDLGKLNPYFTVKTQVTPYKTFALMLGPIAVHPVGDKWIIDNHLLIGVGTLDIESLSYTMGDGAYYYKYTEGRSAFSLAWQAGAGVRYMLLKRFYVGLSVRYVFLQNKMGKGVATLSELTGTERQYYQWTDANNTAHLLQCTLGLAYTFNWNK